MATMPRRSEKAKKILYSIIGMPNAMRDHKTKTQRYIDERVNRDYSRFAR